MALHLFGLIGVVHERLGVRQCMSSMYIDPITDVRSDGYRTTTLVLESVHLRQ
jgi:hypothetical protein